MQQHPLIIIPTYNEATNAVRMIHTLMALETEVDILFVDDGSPDGTAERIKEQQNAYPNRIHLVEREGKLGLGTAYVRGFEYALEHDYEYVCDGCGFSHAPEDVPRLIEAVQSGDTDIAIGSRYANGISIVNWPPESINTFYMGQIFMQDS